MTIYTGAGDGGYTKLGSGAEVSKNDPRVSAYGTVDELSSFIGLAASWLASEHWLKEELLWVQRRLFHLGSFLAFPGAKVPAGVLVPGKQDLRRLEEAMRRLEGQLPALRGFILPGGLQQAAFLHCARSVCRRAERLVSALDHSDYPGGEFVLPFLNRLSDYLFSAARWLNYDQGLSEALAKD